MRSPVLIAETPFANGHGPRFLAPPGRGADSTTAAYYVDRVRDEADDVEEVEGDDYLAVRMALQNESTGDTAPQILIIAGIDVNRMTPEERDEVLEQLRERLEVLGDAVAAIDWTVHGHELVVEIPELEEWHESGWDVLPRSGPWADETGYSAPLPFRGMDFESPQPSDPEPESSHDREEPAPSEPEDSTVERVEDAGDPYHAEPSPEPEPEPAAASTDPEPPAPEPEEPRTFERPDPVLLFESLSLPLSHSRVEPPASATPSEPLRPAPAPEVVDKAPEPRALTAVEPPVQRTIDPVLVSESVDRSPALSPLPPRPADAPRTRPIALRWWVWGPWTAIAVLLSASTCI